MPTRLRQNGTLAMCRNSVAKIPLYTEDNEVIVGVCIVAWQVVGWLLPERRVVLGMR